VNLTKDYRMVYARLWREDTTQTPEDLRIRTLILLAVRDMERSGIKADEDSVARKVNSLNGLIPR
jgi:hypothetical protein